MFHVYVLANEHGKNYIGLSDDVARRLNQHNEGLSKWTNGKGPWSITWTSEAMSRSAVKRLPEKSMFCDSRWNRRP
jgi:putative endonuclease